MENNKATGNDWAGAAHWKKGARKRSPTTADSTDAAGPTSRKKKDNFVNLLLKVSAEAFAKTEPKAVKKGAAKDPYVTTDAAIAKQFEEANLLPHDSGVGVGQLSRLFLRPNAAIRSTAFADGTPSSSAPQQDFTDLTHDNDLGFDGGNDASFAGNDDNFMDDDNIISELEGIRKVEKIEVGYARTSTKVDIKKLKNDIWAELETHESITGGESGQPVSFKGLQDKLDLAQKQTDASTAYYFICALHLANEKGLCFQGQDNLNDFTIVKDGYKDPTFGALPEGEVATTVVQQRAQRAKDFGKMENLK